LAYIQAVGNAGFYAQRSMTSGQDIDDWCTWAMEQASRLDPTITSPPSVLDHKIGSTGSDDFPDNYLL
jgi:hypothetical protein